MASPLEARDIVRLYADGGGVKCATLALRPGKITALLGPSGSGKSTFLRALAGLEPLDSGEVLADDETLSRRGMTVPPERRGIGIVFQDFALFPHLTVLSNIGFGLSGVSGPERQRQALVQLTQVGLASRAKAKPHELSGGEQQRVALARALAPRPRALLLDEPFSSLDPSLRANLRDATFQTLKAAGVPALLVTHEADEALLFADRIAIMHEGCVVQEGEPADLYEHPNSVASLSALGQPNLWHGPVNNGVFESPLGRFTTQGPKGFGFSSANAILAIRNEALMVTPNPHGEARIVARQGVGPSVSVLVAPATAERPLWRAHLLSGFSLSEGGQVQPRLSEQPSLQPGDRVNLSASRAYAFEA